MNFYFPYKPENANEIRIILFLKNDVAPITTILLTHPNNQFEHGGLIKSFIKAYPEVGKIIDVHIKKHEMIYPIADRLARKKIATFCNASSNTYESCIITLPHRLDNTQIENILNFKILYDCYKNPIEVMQLGLDNEPTYFLPKVNQEFYDFIQSQMKEKNKTKDFK